MAHVPKDDTDVLWRELKTRDWDSFHEILSQHKGKTNGISDTLVDMMLEEAKELKKEGIPFPGSADELNQILNERFSQRK